MAENRNLQFLSEQHDHKRCIATAMANADKVCLDRNQRFTKLRKRIFELVWQQHKPIRAYDVLEILQQDGRAAPPTVYRGLDFLIEVGLIHKIESLNAFVGCVEPRCHHQGKSLICTSCNAYAEINSSTINNAITDAARESGFEVKEQTIEIMGICPSCQL